MTAARHAAFAALALLAACDRGESPGVGGVTADEAAQLNNAAEMLDPAPDPAAPEEPPPPGGNEGEANAS